ncbi:hypothetical protein AP064_05645 [Candidatus Liberibacter solanacearum]|uniref:hypothetical protein n=1 Tax=Candidatus Liberibacter solanacearum TaxID=556287 RepID=UPI0006DC6EC4|nr:hypothetical protein [Candidatus Liberibacter solanacearum]KQC48663.1 hypothetical protein AP064_05645 [Candidatus Liberibacter solanacearum]
MNDRLNELLRASKYFENIVDETGFDGIYKLEAINRGVTALTGFNPLKSMGMNIVSSEDEDGNTGDLTVLFDRRGV